jgi:hypothetical protein
VGNDPVYVKTRCFETFPFPAPTAAQRVRIRELGERLDAHRKGRQAAHPGLTLTGMYNVLEKLRAGTPLSDKDKAVHEQGLVSVLREIHDELDAAVLDAYGWTGGAWGGTAGGAVGGASAGIADEDILARLATLNGERAAEEQRGLVRWLRPEYQHPQGHAGAAPVQAELGLAARAASASRQRLPWPKTLPDQAQAVRAALAGLAAPAAPERVARTFLRANRDRVAELLDTLASLGQARRLDDGLYIAA